MSGTALRTVALRIKNVSIIQYSTSRILNGRGTAFARRHKYESYVDLVSGEWTKIRIEVDGQRARLYVHGNEPPTLMVNDVKSGADASGRVALWLEPGTVAHFRNLTVKPRQVGDTRSLR
jgi:hypothetical protein